MNLRASVFHFNAGYERDQDFYLDVGRYTPGPTEWQAEDHYLDLVVRTGAGVELTDVDELVDGGPAWPDEAGHRRTGRPDGG